VLLDAEKVLQSDLWSRGVKSIAELSESEQVALVLKYAIWLPLDVYVKAPWLAPYAVRKNRIRTDLNAPGGKRDLWGIPDQDGYFTDDNSLIKPIPLRRELVPADSLYGDSKVSRGLVCCHVWPRTTTSPLLFSFVPNLAWLPASLAPLTDAHLSGKPHPAHEALKAAAFQRYRRIQPEVGEMRSELAWKLLVEPTGEVTQDSAYIEVGESAAVLQLVHRRIRRLVRFLAATINGSEMPPRFSKRYHAGVGKGIDHSVFPIQDWLSVEAREALRIDMLSCLPSHMSESTSLRGS
jgi:hypothetical protein